MFGDQADKVSGLADFVVESFMDHVESGASLDSWLPPTTACFLGEVRSGFGVSLDDILRQGLRLVAGMAGSLTLTVGEVNEGADDTGGVVDRFSQQVRAHVRARTDTLDDRFGKTVEARPGAALTRIGYLGIRIAANFSALMPTNLAQRRQQAKAKLVDLQTLRDQVDALMPRNFYELMLWLPPADTPMFQSKALERGIAAFNELQEFGDKHNLRVVATNSPNQAAERLIAAEQLAP
jgi:hypothetical protein